MQTILSSSDVADLKSHAQILDSALDEVEELLDVWVDCQTKACFTLLIILVFLQLNTPAFFMQKVAVMLFRKTITAFQ